VLKVPTATAITYTTLRKTLKPVLDTVKSPGFFKPRERHTKAQSSFFFNFKFIVFEKSLMKSVVGHKPMCKMKMRLDVKWGVMGKGSEKLSEK
jgi:hypothetical protein